MRITRARAAAGSAEAQPEKPPPEGPLCDHDEPTVLRDLNGR